MLKNSLAQKIFFEIKKSKKYKNLSNDVILNEINSFLKSNPNLFNSEKLKKKKLEKSIKTVKSKLHRIYSSYILGNKNKREKFLNQLKKNYDLKIINKILKTSVSTKERLMYYEKLYSEIFKITGKPKIIVDIGCGLNPISYPYIGIKDLFCYAYDIEKNDVNFVNKFFKISENFGIRGKAAILNINDLKNISKIPMSDVVFMFKLVDLLNKKNKNLESIIKNLIRKTKFLIVSFPTKTLSGKPMNFPRRKGFEFMLEKNKLKFQILKLKNEIFYIIKGYQ